MSTPECVINAGNLFSNEALQAYFEELGEHEAYHRDIYEQIREHFERRRQQLPEESDAPTVGFYFLGRVLHVLGFTHSHNETLPHDSGRIQYTLFEDADDFAGRVESRGSSQFFAGAVGIAKLLGWSDPLDPEAEDATPDHPAFDLDDIMRQTGLQWGILTNGRIWRLYHRNTVGMINTFFEVNLLEILETADFPAFKYFSGVFSKDTLNTDATGSSVARTLLA